jgi:murein DD-endopeptidase MepM/ murein hydrolase activator NlpD
MGRRLPPTALVATLLFAAWGCSPSAATSSTAESPQTATTTATAGEVVSTTGAVTTTSVPPPPGKNPLCLRRAHFGDPAESPYILPYPVGKAYYVIQSYCVSGNPGGHTDQLAYDFYMPVGSEVDAARGGWVREMRESSPDNGRGYAMENYVWIEHDDGSVAFYAHLMHDGVDVDVGQYVRQGQRIGASGNSGNTGGMPHLHFGVYKRMPNTEEQGIGVNFRNTDGPLDSLGGLLVDELYEALPWDD